MYFLHPSLRSKGRIPASSKVYTVGSSASTKSRSIKERSFPKNNIDPNREPPRRRNARNHVENSHFRHGVHLHADGAVGPAVAAGDPRRARPRQLPRRHRRGRHRRPPPGLRHRPAPAAGVVGLLRAGDVGDHVSLRSGLF